ncbi:hydroxymethylbilane synthase [Reinekea blandensis]|uniref:Porphobilinogen deaminase n=1 Tax=Reinekea blandensis MED297 TaxID=314283 RepID=A4BAP8_9GAMM|nr:hydroxymethylbilane synthase [Reinekea blandensis]EAR11004.1 porphobilinogen deaminase [Reinekea sp. MED297] [Reinekea blandensis MED297]
MSQIVRIATRKSPLALWQAEFVKAELEKHHPDLQVELVKISTKGDQILDVALSKVGGKGLFIKELEVAMEAGEADMAVHSMKDVPMEMPAGFELATICERENPFDAFVSNDFDSIDDLPQGAVLGTSSLRRQAQILAHRPDLDVRFLRGNVGTRLGKLDDGEYQAIVLACAGLIRLDLQARIRQEIPGNLSLPAVGQGAVGIEIRAGDIALKERLQPLSHENTTLRVSAERAMNRVLNGGCEVPIAGYAVLDDQVLKLEGRVGAVDGSKLLKSSAEMTLTGPVSQQISQATDLGHMVARDLLSQGAQALLAEQ